jgi:hypothetical protein
MSNTRLEYQGRLSHYQQHGSQFKGKVYQSMFYNERQNFLYNRLTQGLNYFPEAEIKQMARSKRKRINAFHKKALMIMNKVKQERIVALSDHIFKALFPKSPLAKDLVVNYREDLEETCDMKFDSLKITRDDLIQAFIQAGLLRKDFYKPTLT